MWLWSSQQGKGKLHDADILGVLVQCHIILGFNSTYSCSRRLYPNYNRRESISLTLHIGKKETICNIATTKRGNVEGLVNSDWMLYSFENLLQLGWDGVENTPHVGGNGCNGYISYVQHLLQGVWCRPHFLSNVALFRTGSTSPLLVFVFKPVMCGAFRLTMKEEIWSGKDFEWMLLWERLEQWRYVL